MDMPLADLQRAGSSVIEAICEYHAGLDARPVAPAVTAPQVAARFQDELPEDGDSAEALIADWRERVSPLLTAIGSPRHFAYVNGSGATIGILADALAACTNTNAGAWRLGPAATEIERQCLRWLARYIGYPDDTGGVLVSGGTLANFTAILTALRHVAPYDSTPAGLQDARRGGCFRIYMADHEGHISVVRAADMLNLGRSAVRLVPSRSDFTIDPGALDAMIAADRANGDLPFCVVAQLGSINVGAIDPIGALADVCARHGVWLHGDGANGLLAAGLPETRERFHGLERADSLSFDPHKWLGVPFDCGVVFVRHGERLRRTFSLTAPYLRGTLDTDDHGLDYLEYGPEMSRPFRALKLWMVLRAAGVRGLRLTLARSLALTRSLHALVLDHPDFEVLHEPRLFLYCFRYVPAAVARRTGEPAVQQLLDHVNQSIADAVWRSGFATLMTTRIHGRVALRMSICSQRTREQDVIETFGAIAKQGRELARQLSLVKRSQEELSC